MSPPEWQVAMLDDVRAPESMRKLD